MRGLHDGVHGRYQTCRDVRWSQGSSVCAPIHATVNAAPAVERGEVVIGARRDVTGPDAGPELPPVTSFGSHPTGTTHAAPDSRACPQAGVRDVQGPAFCDLR